MIEMIIYIIVVLVIIIVPVVLTALQWYILVSGERMNKLKMKFWIMKFWIWWFYKCPVGYSFMTHGNGKPFWFYKYGVAIRYKGNQYILITIRIRKSK